MFNEDTRRRFGHERIARLEKDVAEMRSLMTQEERDLEDLLDRYNIEAYFIEEIDFDERRRIRDQQAAV